MQCKELSLIIMEFCEIAMTKMSDSFMIIKGVCKCDIDLIQQFIKQES